jgi:hypothetical protein
LGKARSRGALAAQLPGDVVVLTEHATKVAATEEDRSATVRPAQAVLLAEMGKVGGDNGFATDAAQAMFVDEAVDFTEPGTDDAALRAEES